MLGDDAGSRLAALCRRDADTTQTDLVTSALQMVRDARPPPPRG